MSILVWVILGLIAGWIASLLVGGGYGLIGDIIVGIGGALIGGWLATRYFGMDVTGLNFNSIVISVGGAIILLVVLHALLPGGRKSS